MATSLDLARELVAAAARDLVILRKGAPDAEIPIEALGFHCHQAVEFRYRALPQGKSPVERDRMPALARAVYEWAETRIVAGKPGPE
jgi:hypothetical protein